MIGQNGNLKANFGKATGNLQKALCYYLLHFITQYEVLTSEELATYIKDGTWDWDTIEFTEDVTETFMTPDSGAVSKILSELIFANLV